jgi:hypothetical protein
MEMTVSNRKALLLGICIAIAISTLINAVLWVSEANAHVESKFEPAGLEITKHRPFLMKDSSYPAFRLPAGVVIYSSGIYAFGLYITYNERNQQFCYSDSSQVNCDPKMP